MTRAEAEKHLEVIKAFAEGDPIQVRGPHPYWENVVNSAEFRFHWEYRVKPEPREFWLVPTIGCGLQAGHNKSCHPDAIHVKEVL